MAQATEHDVVFTVQTPITRVQLEAVIKLLNRTELSDEDDSEPLLTIEEVLGNPELLSYLCSSLVYCDSDIHEIWNDDGFCDFADYRK